MRVQGQTFLLIEHIYKRAVFCVFIIFRVDMRMVFQDVLHLIHALGVGEQHPHFLIEHKDPLLFHNGLWLGTTAYWMERVILGRICSTNSPSKNKTKSVWEPVKDFEELPREGNIGSPFQGDVLTPSVNWT